MVRRVRSRPEALEEEGSWKRETCLSLVVMLGEERARASESDSFFSLSLFLLHHRELVFLLFLPPAPSLSPLSLSRQRAPMIASAPMRSCASFVPACANARGSQQPAPRREQQQPQAMARHSTTPATPRPRLFPRRRRRRGLLALAPAGAAPSRGGGGGGAPPPPGSPGDIDVRIRSEVEAPFRTVRLVLFGFFAGSASVGAAIAATQVLGAFLRARNGDTGGIALADAATSLAVDLGAVGLFAFLFSRDWAAREKQIARLQREADLGALRLRLSTGARRRLASLRGFARPVIVFGTQAQVEAALAAAEPLREQLESRGVLIVPAPFLDGAGDDRAWSGGEASSSSSAPSSDNAKGDLRWKAQALDSAAWRAWFEQQAKLANNAKIRNGLYGERKKKSFFSSGQGWEFRALARKLERKNKNSPPPPSSSSSAI